MPTFLSALHAIDAEPGRMCIDDLPDQSRMELLIEGTTEETKRYFQDADGEFIDVCEWGGVGCNDNGDVTLIRFCTIKGEVSLDFIPLNVKKLDIIWGDVQGTLNRAKLPRGLEEFSSDPFFEHQTMLHGDLNLSEFPPNLREFHVPNNSFEGSCDLTSLPEKLELLYLNGNKFTGEINLEKLPHSLMELDISENRLRGGVSLANLPDSLTMLKMHVNKLSGSLEFHLLPDGLQKLNVSENDFSGVIYLMNYDFIALQKLVLSHNKLSWEFPFEDLPGSIRTLNIESNEFTGIIPLEDLPRRLKTLRAGDNKFYGGIDLEDLPVTCKLLHLENNWDLSGPLNFDELPPAIETLNIRGTSFGRDDLFKSCPFEFRKPHPNLKELDATLCQFSGTAVIHRAMREYIKISYNDDNLVVVDESGCPYDEVE